MKKIIYSLVIMIAAGSLFTSCIDQVEPVGILDMRSAKAEYIRALKDLRAADAEFRRAEAALKQADARYRDAETAWMNAQTENQNLLNELQALLNEAQAMENELRAAQIADEIARMAMKMEEDAKQHEINMLDLEQELQQAAEDLRVALRNIALHSQDLTNDEKLAVAEAVAMYEGIFEVYQKQVVKVKEAQALVDSLKEWKRRFADKDWDSDNHNYRYKVDLWEREIKRAEHRIEINKARLEDLPSPDEIDMNEWDAELKAMQDEIDALTYNFNTTTVKEIAQYYVTYVHDGVKDFNDAVKVFVDALGEETSPYSPYFTYSDLARIVNGDATGGKFYKGNAYEITFPALAKGDISAATFNKFAFLLKSYYDKVSPLDDEVKVMENKDNTIKILSANQKMKDFILGKLGNGENSQKYEWTVNKEKKSIVANYGLWGAYDILERELVTSMEEAASPEKLAELKKNMAEQDSIWKTHREILIKGLVNYKPYQDALKAYTEAVSKNGKGATNMVDAIKKIKTAFAHVEGVTGANFDYYDSTEIFKALQAYAAAREEYLDYKAPKAKDIDAYDAAKRDSTVFYYSKGSSGASKAIPASKKFTELTFAELQKGEYEFEMSDPGDVKPYPGHANAFGNIIKQLLGDKFVTALTADPIAAVAANDMSEAMYNTYTLSTWDDPKKIQKGGEDYMSADITAKKDAVRKAVNDFINVYNSFWNQNVTAAKTTDRTEHDAYFTAVEGGAKADKIAEELKKAEKAVNDLFDSTLDPECYTLATFKPYADEAPIVTFSNGTDVDNTDAMCAVLTAVDPACTDKTLNEYFKNNAISGGAIFNGNATDFYNYMKACYDYYKAANPNIKDELAAIKAWIESVEAAFEKDATDAGKEDANAEYAYLISKYKYEAWTEFTGESENQEWYNNAYRTVPNGYWWTPGIYGTYDDPESITPDNLFELFSTNVLGDCDGWIPELGGQLLELAETLFPEFPTEWQGWKEAIEEYNDEKAHLEILIDSFKTAYFAAAKAAGYDEFSKDGKKAKDWDQLFQAYKDAREAYVQTLKNKIKADTQIIDDNAKNIANFWSEVPVIDIEIADAEADLTIQKHRLAALEQALAYAKANMEKILEYVQSQDASYVLLNADASNAAFDLNALNALIDLLKSLGISIPGLV